MYIVIRVEKMYIYIDEEKESCSVLSLVKKKEKTGIIYNQQYYLSLEIYRENILQHIIDIVVFKGSFFFLLKYFEKM